MARIADLTAAERPRERLQQWGAEQLSDVDLLAILLRTGRKDHSVLDVAREVYEEVLAQNISQSGMSSWRDFLVVKGVGTDKAVTLSAAIELGRRVAARERSRRDRVNMSKPEAVRDYFMHHLRDKQHEEVHVCFLDTKNGLIRTQLLSQGGMNSSVVDVRLLMKEALRWNAVSMILVHNHPSGNPEPSRDDIALTRRLADAGLIMDIRLLDHVIIGDGEFTSMKRRGLL